MALTGPCDEPASPHARELLMGSSRNVVVLARHAASQLRSAACKDSRSLWDAAEAVVEISPLRAVAAAAAPLVQMCLTECRVQEACLEWARFDRYTGVAGGQVLVEGRNRSRSRNSIAALPGAAGSALAATPRESRPRVT